MHFTTLLQHALYASFGLIDGGCFILLQGPNLGPELLFARLLVVGCVCNSIPPVQCDWLLH